MDQDLALAQRMNNSSTRQTAKMYNGALQLIDVDVRWQCILIQ